jgi:hypothetical protein
MIVIDLDGKQVMRTANLVAHLNARAISTGFRIPAATGLGVFRSNARSLFGATSGAETKLRENKTLRHYRRPSQPHAFSRMLRVALWPLS